MLTGKLKKDAEDCHACGSEVRFDVTVTDDAGGHHTDFAFFRWEGQCSSPSRRNVAKKTIENLAEEIYSELPKSVAKHAVEVALSMP